MITNGSEEPRSTCEENIVILNGATITQQLPISIYEEADAIQDGTFPSASEVVDKISKGSLTPGRGSNNKYDPPSFSVQLDSYKSVEEGEPIRLETKVCPADDNSLQVNWFKDGKLLNAGSRFATVMDRGLVILDIMYTIEDDAGDYTCIAKSNSGMSESNKSNIEIIPEKKIEYDVQLPEEMMQDHGQYDKCIDDRHETTVAPRFVNQTSGPIFLEQGQSLTFEMLIEPKSDGSLIIDWTKDGHALNNGSRINTFCDRGYCVLEIAYCYPEDSGSYRCIAKNSLGEAQSDSVQLICKSGESIVTKSNLNEFSMSQLRSLENPGEEFSQYHNAPSNPIPPTFIDSVESEEITVLEGSPAYFEVNVDPGNGQKLSFDWYLNDKVVTTCSRLTGKLEMNVASLNIQYTLRVDTGVYKCVVLSENGSAETKPFILNVEIDKSIVLDPQSKGIRAIRALEAELNAIKPGTIAEEICTDHPSFSKDLDEVGQINEGDSVVFSVGIEPAKDNTLHVEWYKNDKHLITGSRFHFGYERGVASLCINSAIAEDSGHYWLMAINKNGEKSSNKVKLLCIGGESIVTKSNLMEDSEGYRRIKEMEDDLATNGSSSFRHVEEEEFESSPNFDVKPLNVTAIEGGPAKFLVRVSGFPRPTIEWKIENEVVISDSVCKHYNDGSINYLEINRCCEIGESRISVTASNHLGSSVTEAILTVMPTNDFRPDLRRTNPDNPYKKMLNLKKIECTSELNNAFRKQKSNADKIVTMEKHTEYKSRTYRSPGVLETEKMYGQVASNLKRNNGRSYCNGIKTININENENPEEKNNAVTTNELIEQ